MLFQAYPDWNIPRCDDICMYYTATNRTMNSPDSLSLTESCRKQPGRAWFRVLHLLNWQMMAVCVISICLGTLPRRADWFGKWESIISHLATNPTSNFEHCRPFFSQFFSWSRCPVSHSWFHFFPVYHQPASKKSCHFPVEDLSSIFSSTSAIPSLHIESREYRRPVFLYLSYYVRCVHERLFRIMFGLSIGVSNRKEGRVWSGSWKEGIVSIQVRNPAVPNHASIRRHNRCGSDFSNWATKIAKPTQDSARSIGIHHDKISSCKCIADIQSGPNQYGYAEYESNKLVSQK